MISQKGLPNRVHLADGHVIVRAGIPQVLEQASDNLYGLLPGILHQAGFEQVTEPASLQTIFGSLSYYSGRKTGE